MGAGGNYYIFAYNEKLRKSWTKLDCPVAKHHTTCPDIKNNVLRPVAMGWHGEANATPGQQNASFLPPREILCIFIVAFSL